LPPRGAASSTSTSWRRSTPTPSKAEQNAIHELGLDQRIEDITITLDRQVHLIRPLERNRSMFVYVALDKASSNLGMARIQLKAIEAAMVV
jgi:hypothetical protein